MTICLPIAKEKKYGTLVKQTKKFRQYLDQQIALHPELFPRGIGAGYRFHGFRTSAKLKIESRGISLLSKGEVYQLRSDFVLPYHDRENRGSREGRHTENGVNRS